jgi:hypothetical protein
MNTSKQIEALRGLMGEQLAKHIKIQHDEQNIFYAYAQNSWAVAFLDLFRNHDAVKFSEQWEQHIEATRVDLAIGRTYRMIFYFYVIEKKL